MSVLFTYRLSQHNAIAIVGAWGRDNPIKFFSNTKTILAFRPIFMHSVLPLSKFKASYMEHTFLNNLLEFPSWIRTLSIFGICRWRCKHRRRNGRVSKRKPMWPKYRQLHQHAWVYGVVSSLHQHAWVYGVVSSLYDFPKILIFLDGLFIFR